MIVLVLHTGNVKGLVPGTSQFRAVALGAVLRKAARACVNWTGPLIRI